MATRSAIGIQNPDGSVDYIYCHWDGYPSYNGKLLLENYTDEEKVRKLISLGALSALGKSIEPSPEFKHTFTQPQDDVCIFYCRDRGDELSVNHIVKPLTTAQMERGYLDYSYLFQNGAWIYKARAEKYYKPLTPAECGMKETA